MVMEEINKIHPGMENRNTFTTNGKDVLGLSITMPIPNVSLQLRGSYNCHDEWW